MFDLVQQLYASRGYTIDLANSLFVGDAAGRVGGKGSVKDHDNTDLKFALNVGVRFKTPEVGCAISALNDGWEPAADDRNTSWAIPSRCIPFLLLASILRDWVLSQRVSGSSNIGPL